MNLTNNNPVGCRQVANCGGLDPIATLLVAYFPKPSFDTLQGVGSTTYDKLKGKGSDTDQDLEMVVVALGVLCNLVERDEINRLASFFHSDCLFCTQSVISSLV